MIDRAHDASVARQCQILSLAHSTAYYQAQEANEAELVLMRRIGALHLEYAFCLQPGVARHTAARTAVKYTALMTLVPR